MNILFISKLSGNLWAGPNNSVPAQIKAQSQTDNCFWYNLNHVKREEWQTDELSCKNLDDYPSKRLSDLPSPFNHPDIVVIEEVYCYPFEKIILEIINAKIPYVIIPRSVLTIQAQNQKKLKKIIGNVIWFNYVIRNAAAVQYLTKSEKEESIGKFHKKCFVIPNGITMPIERTRLKEAKYKKINISYIGRIDFYQKGIDLLIETINKNRENMTKYNCAVNLYGPINKIERAIILNKIEEYRLNELLFVHDSVFGEEKKKVLLNTDIFIMTSRFEGLPMGLIEALSYGIPCFVTKGTNMDTEILRFNAGWTSNNQIESISSVFNQMIQEREQVVEKGENARILASNYSWTRIAQKSHKVYSRIIGEIVDDKGYEDIKNIAR